MICVFQKLNILNKKLFLLISVISFLFSERGDLLSYDLIATRSISNAQAYIDDELAQIVTDIFSIEPAQYGYRMYRITYETIDVHGNVNIASGVVSCPRVDWPDIANQAFPIVSYQHGTVVEKSSVTSIDGEWILPAILTSAGYVYVEQDYLGLGVSSGRHPYQLKEPYGFSGIDILRAVREFAEQNQEFELNDQLFLTGYSEGGYAAMAMHQIIERDYSGEFQVTISLPLAGAYSMSGVMVDLMLSQIPYGEPFYFPYVLFSYLEAYPSIGTSEQFLLPEYLFLEEMFDGYHSSVEINNAMPSIPITIMKPEEIIEFENSFYHPLRASLRENDLYDWNPIAPIHMLHGLGDELVPFENAQIAYNNFINNGAENIVLESIPESFGGHSEVAPWALFGAYQRIQDMKLINELGDMNQDGSLNIFDLILIVNSILYDIDSYYLNWAADVNLDDQINIIDLIILTDNILEI